MFEIREIPFLDGLYATSDGRILDKEFNEFKKWINTGYYEIHYNGKYWRVHRLIAIVFIPNPENKSDVHHINYNKLDNRVENLVWLSRSEHQVLHTKGKIPKANPPKPVYQYTLDGKLVKIWDSTKECGRNGFSQCAVVDCCNGKRKTHKGYIWSYVPL